MSPETMAAFRHADSWRDEARKAQDMVVELRDIVLAPDSGLTPEAAAQVKQVFARRLDDLAAKTLAAADAAEVKP